MKNCLLLLAGAVLLTLVMTSCRENILMGEGSKTIATTQVPAFSGVDIAVSLKAVINVSEGSTPTVKISGSSNVLQHIKTSVENGRLKIYTDLDATWSIDDDGLQVIITTPVLAGLNLSGASDADLHGHITGRELKIDASGASDITIDSVSVDNFSLQLSGAGDVEIGGGIVKHAEFEINGAADLKAYGMQADEVKATISGTGSGEVTARQKLTATISGAGEISYKGHPVITQSVSGVGEVKDAN